MFDVFLVILLLTMIMASVVMFIIGVCKYCRCKREESTDVEKGSTNKPKPKK